MAPLIVLAVTFVLLWLLFILPQQRRVRAHQVLVASVEPGDEVILSAGIYGRIVDLGPEEMTLAVAPGVELRVARQAVLRRVEDVTGGGEPHGADPHDTGSDTVDTGSDEVDHTDEVDAAGTGTDRGRPTGGGGAAAGGPGQSPDPDPGAPGRGPEPGGGGLAPAADV